MQQESKSGTKPRFRLSDKQLQAVAKLAKGFGWYSVSCVVFWGVWAAVGGVALGLHALGVGIPHFLGLATVVTGALMTLKSVAMQYGCQALHRKCLKVQDKRLQEKAANDLGNAPANALSKDASIKASGGEPVVATVAGAALQQKFNPYAGIVLVLVQKPVATGTSADVKFAPLRRPEFSFRKA